MPFFYYSYSFKPRLKLFLQCFYIASNAGRERVLFSYTAPIKNMHICCISFSVTTFVRLLTNFQKERDMTGLNKKWLSGLVAGALMAVSVGTLAAEQKHSTFITGLIISPRIRWQILKKRPVSKSSTMFLIPTKCWKAN